MGARGQHCRASSPCRRADAALPTRAPTAGRPLDGETRAFFEPRFGFDFSNIRVHDDGQAAQTARDLDARALTIDRDLVFASGAYAPGTSDGRTLLAHELAHVVQGARRPEAAARVGDGTISHAGDPAEREAESAAHAVVAGGGPVALSGTPRAAIHRQPAAATAATPDEKAKAAAITAHEEVVTHVQELLTDTLAVPAPTLAAGPYGPSKGPTQPPAPQPLPTQGSPAPPAPTPSTLLTLPADPLQQFINTAEWLTTKSADNSITFRVLTQTHYPANAAGKVAYFDATKKYPDVSGDYPLDPSVASPSVVWESPSLGGERKGSTNEIRLFADPGTSDDEIRKRLIHEVQHDADKHDAESTRAVIAAIKLHPPKETQAQADDRVEKVRTSSSLWARYKTEFRAYWVDAASQPTPAPMFPPPALPSPVTVQLPAASANACTPNTRATSFTDGKQKKIFEHLIASDATYGFATPYVCDQEFRDKVDAYSRPEGLNLINSVRIDTLVNAIHQCDSSMDGTNPKVIAMLAAADKLDDKDHAFLRGGTTMVDTLGTSSLIADAKQFLSATVLATLAGKV